MSELNSWAMGQIKSLDISEQKKYQYKMILNAFSKQGHSGTSAAYALAYINKYIKDGYDSVKQTLEDIFLNKTKNSDEYNMQYAITKDIMEILDMFRQYNLGDEEAHNLSRLMDWKPIIPLTGAEDEWSDPMKFGDDDKKQTQQNKICSAVFRDNYDNKTARYIDGRVYSDNGGHSWFTGNHKNGVVKSSVPVVFPFWVPDKPEYIYLNGRDSEEIITDNTRIKELYDEWERSFKNE